MNIRWGTEKDAAVLANVFYASVRAGPSPYSQAQRAAWMPQPPDPENFAQRLRPMHVILAEQAEVCGFMAMRSEGYIDLAFILPAHRGRGVFRKLYAEIEIKANDVGITRLWTHASLAAEPAFQAVGFSVIQHETVILAGEELSRTEMEKYLK